MVDDLLLGVEPINYHIRIATVTSCEHHYLELLRQISQDLSRVAPNIDTSLHDFSAHECYGKSDVGWLSHIHAVY